MLILVLQFPFLTEQCLKGSLGKEHPLFYYLICLPCTLFSEVGVGGEGEKDRRRLLFEYPLASLSIRFLHGRRGGQGQGGGEPKEWEESI